MLRRLIDTYRSRREHLHMGARYRAQRNYRSYSYGLAHHHYYLYRNRHIGCGMRSDSNSNTYRKPITASNRIIYGKHYLQRWIDNTYRCRGKHLYMVACYCAQRNNRSIGNSIAYGDDYLYRNRNIGCRMR